MVLEEMAKKEWRYDLALAIYLVKKDLFPHVLFFTQNEMNLMKEYAKKGEDGKPVLSENGSFPFEDPNKAAEFYQKRDSLYYTEILDGYVPKKACAPDSISPAELEALEGLIEWRDNP